MKKKLIALGIIAFSFFVIFPYSFLNLKGDSGVLHILGMAFIIVSCCIAILTYNGASQDEH